jgi:hypothetical protein
MTTYFVSGYMRTGTSMMMKALEAGGLDAVHNTSRNALNDRHGDEHYTPNGGGFYELSRREYMQPGFPRMYSDRLIKFLVGGICRIVAGNYKIVFMRRDPEEMRQSYQAFFNDEPALVGDAYVAASDDAIGILEQRRDVNLIVFDYRDVVRHPLEAFNRLKIEGWPIDAVKAAAVVNPKLCRFKLESLQVGV